MQAIFEVLRAKGSFTPASIRAYLERLDGRDAQQRYESPSPGPSVRRFALQVIGEERIKHYPNRTSRHCMADLARAIYTELHHASFHFERMLDEEVEDGGLRDLQEVIIGADGQVVRVID